MTRIALTAAVLALSACTPHLGDTDYPIRYMMVSEGIGDITLEEGYLKLDDGSELPIQKLADGVYALPSRPTKLPNGTDFCSGRPVDFFTLHRTTEGLVAMNVGDWMEVPVRPAADTVQAPGACATFTFRPA